MVKGRWMLTTAFCLVLALTGCLNEEAGKTGSELSPEAALNQEKTKLRFWSSGRHDAQYILEAVKRFNASNKDHIEVEMTVIADDFTQSLDLSFISEQSPDVFTPIDLADMVARKEVAPLNGFMTPEDKTRFAEHHFVEGYNMFGGKIYSLPSSGSTLRLIYNEDLFERAGIHSPPKSLASLVEAAKKIASFGKSEGIYGFALPYKNPSSALGRSVVPIAEISGIGGRGYDYSTGTYDFAGLKPVIQAFRTMMENGSTLPGSESLDIDPLRAQFADGKIGMYLSYSSEPSIYKVQFPAKIRWNAALPPSVDGVYKGVINQGIGATRWLAISSKSRHKEAAWKFLRYMYSEEVLIGYQEAGLGILSVDSLARKAGKPKLEGMEPFLPGRYDGIWPAIPHGVQPQGRKWEEEFARYIMVGGDLDSIISDLNFRYNAALEQERAAGRIKMKAIPHFDPMNPQGKGVLE